MNLESLIQTVSRFLQEEKLRHFVFGAVGMDFWVKPRTTNDLDLVLDVQKRAIPGLARKLNGLGFRMAGHHERKFADGKIVTLPIGKTRLDLKKCASKHDREALRRARLFERGSTRLRIATPEDILLYKLVSFRRQDQADIERIHDEVDALDMDHIESWLDRLSEESGTPMRKRWQEFR